MARTSAIRTRVACAFVAILSLIALSFAAPIAHAAEGNIDPNTKGSMTIHKFANPDSGQTGDGTDLGEKKPTTEPVSGVVFEYQKAKDINLATAEGWEKAKTVKLTEGRVMLGDQAAIMDSAVEFAPTGSNGETTVKDLALGVYLVTEKSAPANVTEKAAPFLVTIPYPNEKESFLYDVHVYPKNTVVTDKDWPIKTVKGGNDTVHFPGDTIMWEIKQTVPQLSTKKPLTKFEISDQLPKGVDKIESNAVAVSVKRGGEAPGLKATTTVSETNLVTVKFEDDQLQALKSGDVVTVTITAKVALTVKGDELANQSTTNINDVQFGSVPSVEDIDLKNPTKKTPTVISFAPLKIDKVNKENKPLADAQFHVWPLPKNGQCGTKPEKAQLMTTSGDQGTVTLQMAIGTYCVQETKAPLGYEIAADYATPQKIEVVKDSGKKLTVINLKSAQAGTNGLLNLPLTGAAGMVVMTLLGAALIAAAFGFGFVALRRNKD
ncbi:SpaH/EbpB family LPXTG-anchored major pilin [Arcanobacterium canis]